MTATATAPPKKKRHVFRWIVLGVIALGVIGSLASHGNKGGTSSSDSSAASAAPAAAVVTDRIAGTFHRDCLACGDLASRIRTGAAWCAWSGNDVLVHVTMQNTSVEHVTVTWHPSYTIADGASHGTGLSSLQDSGFDAGQTRSLTVKQTPQGVPSGSPLASCEPSFYLVKSG